MFGHVRLCKLRINNNRVNFKSSENNLMELKDKAVKMEEEIKEMMEEVKDILEDVEIGLNRDSIAMIMLLNREIDINQSIIDTIKSGKKVIEI